MDKFITGITFIFFLLTASICISPVTAEEIQPPPKPAGHMKPPPEAIAACQGKNAGTIVQFTTRRGDVLRGVCKQLDGVLAAMPERGGQPPRGCPPPDVKKGQQPE